MRGRRRRAAGTTGREGEAEGPARPAGERAPRFLRAAVRYRTGVVVVVIIIVVVVVINIIIIVVIMFSFTHLDSSKGNGVTSRNRPETQRFNHRL